jgi:hypothetical protein
MHCEDFSSQFSSVYFLVWRSITLLSLVLCMFLCVDLYFEPVIPVLEH